MGMVVDMYINDELIKMIPLKFVPKAHIEKC